MVTAVSDRNDKPAEVFHLRIGRTCPEDRVRHDVALYPGGHLGRRPRRISESSAVTIASWWHRHHPILRALVEHYPVDRAELDAAVTLLENEIDEDPTHSTFDLEAVRALRHFVRNYDD
ncbi:hypothetical protein HQ325_16690 [Rhodococcus sp. BP-349]|uniref:hypothetical protein n=1 Tax=unclassified Rhodococcus (in: high G+C Gram-positive bacteria) TaxID=192944 RepID=UPI001C9B67AC|nr:MULTISPECIES: hypothetical protein [unclassified Rhodococcus (in: high G+C Gram-positive bacteria)]MBY6540313.1 hypothetical protein [Rhodococcus sp. BP-363]MBY6545662.1 hypothetical protein [Rhodococcus sp. BP-369]MBY6564892.1 hypothetical protein [Rhodococcus sp. BP-370]MBY6578172.1 hypothetical protein [Rhodococcus sp. BP-364]MBY6587473.1 hypothetical protein [Rhodococcus sp. BP-358]